MMTVEELWARVYAAVVGRPENNAHYTATALADAAVKEYRKRFWPETA